jgi:hypothetical protein
MYGIAVTAKWLVHLKERRDSIRRVAKRVENRSRLLRRIHAIAAKSSD